MEKSQQSPQGLPPILGAEKKKRLPTWAGWLIGWAAALSAAAGLCYFWRVVFSLGALPVLPMTLFAMALASILYAALFLVTRLRGDVLCLQAAIAVFTLGLLLCFASAPLQAPDETSYFLRAQSISRGVFIYQHEADYSPDVDMLADIFAPPMNHMVRYQGAQLPAAALSQYAEGLVNGAVSAPAAPSAAFQLLPFLPQGLFIALARSFGFSALGQLYAARIANLLVYTVLCYFAFKNAESRRGIFFAFALLPVSLFMAASCSYDGPTLALCFLAVSIFCKAQVRGRDLLAFTAALMIANYSKPLNFLLAPLLLLVPRRSWRVKLKPWAALALAAAAAVGFWFIMDKIDRQISYAGGWPTPDMMPRGSGDAADTGAQLRFMLRYPLRFAAVSIQSIAEADGFLFDIGRLGHMDMPLPLLSGLSVLGLCCAAALAANNGQNASPFTRRMLAGIALTYSAAVLAGMYITDTDVGSIRITGPQPRYFIPAFLLLFIFFACFPGKTHLTSPLRAAPNTARAQVFTLCMASAVAFAAVLMLFQNYFIGQWIPKAEGGWKLVNLLGWQAV